MTETNTNDNDDTEIEPYELPRVVIRRSWVVVAAYIDEDGDPNFYDEEFVDKAEAIVHAAQQADKYGVGITYGHECN